MGKFTEKYKALQKWQKAGRELKPFLPEEMEETVCMNCDTHFHGNYCPNCGQAAKTHRLSFMGVIRDVLQLIGDLDSRSIRTCLELFYRPGHMIREYVLDGKRAPYLKPISMLFFLSTIYIVMRFLLFPKFPLNGDEVANGVVLDLASGLNDGLNNEDVPLPQWIQETGNSAYFALKKVTIFLYENKGARTLAGLLLMLIPYKFIYKKTEIGEKMNLMEYFYLICFMGCLGLLISIMLMPYMWLTNQGFTESSNLYDSNFLVDVWVTRQFFCLSWKESFVKQIKLFFASILFVIQMLILIAIIGAILGAIGWFALWLMGEL
ncbi:MAG: DUF3667 domain-containing protein [Bacteroidales bacterium]|nr:DUF3667 domain-containing protein [Bacteroidales bacterium]